MKGGDVEEEVVVAGRCWLLWGNVGHYGRGDGGCCVKKIVGGDK